MSEEELKTVLDLSRKLGLVVKAPIYLLAPGGEPMGGPASEEPPNVAPISSVAHEEEATSPVVAHDVGAPVSLLVPRGGSPVVGPVSKISDQEIDGYVFKESDSNHSIEMCVSAQWYNLFTLEQVLAYFHFEIY